MYNLLLGGAAGQGIETTVAILQKILRNAGYHVFTVRDFMSRVRGGHNFSLVRFGTEPVQSHSYSLDGIIALTEETIELHRGKLKQDGFILCDSRFASEDSRTIKADFTAIGKELGNPRVVGSAALGVLLRLFSLSTEKAEKVLAQHIKEQYLDVNVQALNRGYDLVDSRYALLQGDGKDQLLISGSEALGLGAIAAGLRFYSAYPMSPSTAVMEYLAEQSLEAGIVVEQAEDEIAAVNMAIGASFAGVPAMTGTSGGGFSLMVEALGFAGIAEIPLVIVNVQRPGPATGLPTRTEQSDLKFMISASQGEFPRMVIALRNHTDAFYQTARALWLAEKYQIPVLLLSDQYLGDSYATVQPYDLDSVHRVSPKGAAEDFLSGQALKNAKEWEYRRYRFTEDGISPRLLPGQSEHLVAADSDEHDEYGKITESAEMRRQMMDKRLGKLKLLEEELLEPEFIGVEEYDTLLLGWGSTYGPIREAVSILNREQGKGYAALVFGDIFPLPQKLLKEKAAKAVRIINVEQNATGQLAQLIREQTGIECGGSILKYDGRQLSAEEIAEKIRKEVRV